MGRVGRLFSFSGRMSRRAYWRTQRIFVSIWALLVVVSLGLAVYLGMPWLAAIAVAATFLLGVPGLACSFRRLHDRGKSAWWLLPFGLGAALAIVSVVLLGRETADAMRAGAAAAGLIGLVLYAWGVVEIGLRDGTPGPNRYGPDPLAA